MGPVFGVALPLVLATLAVLFGRRELRLYRAARDGDSDLFVYSRGRLWRRLTGLAVLVSTGVTLAAMEFLPASTARGASIYLALIAAQVVALFVLPIVDLIETARTARPGAGLSYGKRPDKPRRDR
jgi:hypothetical protein